jgi:hypothetical protein
LDWFGLCPTLRENSQGGVFFLSRGFETRS